MSISGKMAIETQVSIRLDDFIFKMKGSIDNVSC